MSAPSFRFRLPPKELFKWPPTPIPFALPPPREARTFASPFPINGEIYNAVLDWKVPVTIGAVYAATAILMNKINRDRNYKAWGFSKTKSFHYFVLLHNIFLAVFSALTFVGMIRALAHTWPSRRDVTFLGKFWPGMRTEHGIVGAVDALCKIHGPRGFGDAVFYQPDKTSWASTNRNIALTAAGAPDPADVGRLWNEGLAFWGWWFYLSKFYEVLDTFIILAKGKRSSTLQTYHHTGAMACMWAGIRYMSPPIWMFCFLNSGIHALMYTYYTLSALRIRVPQRIKRTLTTMQISQFLIGITFASLHLFVIYSIPVSTPYTLTQTISSAASAASAAVSQAAEAAPTSLGRILQRFILRGAGQAGLADRVDAPRFINKGGNLSANVTRETKWRNEYAYIPCIDTDGQAFAIWLNVFYLAPLTLLFVRFFIRSYTRGGAAGRPKTQRPVSKVVEDAARSVDQELESYSKAAENGVGDLANNVINRMNGSNGNASRPNNNRRKSSNIEKISTKYEHTPEKQSTSGYGSGAEQQQQQSNRSNTPTHLRAETIRKKASAEHNKLRKLFEEGVTNNFSSGNDARSVNPTTNPHSLLSSPGEAFRKAKTILTEPFEKSQPYTEDAVGKLQRMAEEKVRGVREAVGGQAARAPDEDTLSGALPEVEEQRRYLLEEMDRVRRRSRGDRLSSSEVNSSPRSLADELAGSRFGDSESGSEVKDNQSYADIASKPPAEDNVVEKAGGIKLDRSSELNEGSYAAIAASTPDPDNNSIVDFPSTTTPSTDAEDPVSSSASSAQRGSSPHKSKIPKASRPSQKGRRSPTKGIITPASTTTSTTFG